MACTTLLVGKGATYDGSTMIARDEDDGDGSFCPKKMVVVEPADQPRHYHCVISHLDIELPDTPQRYTAMPNVDPKEGIWAAAGVNASNVSMSATETITTNPRVLGGDPLVSYRPAQGTPEQKDHQAEQVGGIGEEDMVTLVLPYIASAREGVLRLGQLLERYGTYESNGIAFSDENEVWYLETIGGHHWIARRVPDNCYVTQPNQLGIDRLDLLDATGDGQDYLASSDIIDFIVSHKLDLAMPKSLAHSAIASAVNAINADKDRLCGLPRIVNPRVLFGSHDYADHIYNTPRAWYMQRCLNPSDSYDGPAARYQPESDDLPWCRVPERKITVEDVKQVLSSHYQETPFDPYGTKGTELTRKFFRPIGINRNCECALIQIRPYLPEGLKALQWVAMGDMTYSTFIPLYTQVDTIPAYLDVAMRTTTETFYWQNRIIAALADAQYGSNWNRMSSYQDATLGQGHAQVEATDSACASLKGTELSQALAAANQKTCDLIQKATDDLLAAVLFTTSVNMRDRFTMSDR